VVKVNLEGPGFCRKPGNSVSGPSWTTFRAFGARHPIHTLLYIIPVERHAVITCGEVQHRSYLICPRSVSTGIVTLDFSENYRMMQQLVDIICRKHVDWGVKYGKICAKAITAAVTKALDYGLDTDVLLRVAALDEMPDCLDAETLLAGLQSICAACPGLETTSDRTDEGKSSYHESSSQFVG
jgi:hypothetical protein